MAGSSGDNRTWRIVSLDPEIGILLTSPTPLADGTSRDLSPSVNVETPAGAAGPQAQWVSGPTGAVRVSATWAAVDTSVDLSGTLASLERLTARDPVLGRAPRVRLEDGPSVVEGFVVSLRLTLARWAVAGTLRLIVAELEIVPAARVIVETEQPALRETTWVEIPEGGTWEHLAARLLGDPLRGTLIADLNPREAVYGLQGGDRVRVFEAEHPAMRKRVAPVAPCFVGDSWRAALQALAEDRGTVTRGMEYARHPDGGA